MIGQWGGPAFISACQNSVYQALMNKALGKRLAFWMFMVSQDPPPPPLNLL